LNRATTTAVQMAAPVPEIMDTPLQTTPNLRLEQHNVHFTAECNYKNGMIRELKLTSGE
jgi:hypothetical protein